MAASVMMMLRSENAHFNDVDNIKSSTMIIIIISVTTSTIKEISIILILMIARERKQ